MTLSPATRARRRVFVSTIVGVLAIGACSSSTPDGPAPTSVPTSASVSVPAGQAPRSAPGSSLAFGESAVLPANAFAAAGRRAMFTVTGITPGTGVPDDVTDGGVAYFLYVTVTSLADRPAPAPSVIGLSGSADGMTPTLTLAPTPGLAECPQSTPPEQMSRGESYATCLVSVADPEQRLEQVIYWADTTSDPALDYQSAPVVWAPAPSPSASPPPTG
ncbi:hypothetical protein V1Y59_14065 [Gordonia sp. PKS22-38]|uniref:MPT63-like domain-containing protein n=1 Tax=Gordonia prachuapensis TaxID=3115651 RepID=A0ABU7MVQ3_9ACTN|nr:hypothetical protein [Gordonia sp. PKS22-38]